jgi:hypothetical protein
MNERLVTETRQEARHAADTHLVTDAQDVSCFLGGRRTRRAIGLAKQTRISSSILGDDCGIQVEITDI